MFLCSYFFKYQVYLGWMLSDHLKTVIAQKGNSSSTSELCFDSFQILVGIITFISVFAISKSQCMHYVILGFECDCHPLLWL